MTSDSASWSWPPPGEWPKDDAPALDFARFYRDRLGLEVRPTPSSLDLIHHTRYLTSQAEADYEQQHGAKPPQEVSVAMWDDARELAEDTRRGPVPMIAASHKGREATDEDLVRWWGPKGGKRCMERGICFLLGATRGGIGVRLAQVDVDVKHGADLDGPHANLEGPTAVTPSGGCHVFVLHTPDLRPCGGKTAPAKGIEVRCNLGDNKGLGVWAVLPSGASSPDRLWARRDPPIAAPPGLLAPTKPVRQAMSAATSEHTGSLGHVASILGAEVHEGERNDQAVRVVGLLARPGACPPDFVSAALELLVEYAAGRDWPETRVREECQRWRLALTRGPRDAEFAAEVLATWVSVRDNNPRPWKAGKARALARSVWKTADRREEGRAGEEDVGHLGELVDVEDEREAWKAAQAAPPQPPPPLAIATPQAPSEVVEVAGPPPETPPAAPTVATTPPPKSPPTEAEEKAAAHERRLRAFMVPIGKAYTIEDMFADFARTPVAIDTLYPFLDFITGREEGPETPGVPDTINAGHGLGPQFNRSIGGGLVAGDCYFIGGAGAKIGKTHLLGQFIEGMALSTAARLLGVAGYESAPLVLPVWISEMPKKGEIVQRMMCRHFGCDLAAIALGTTAEDAPGITRMANDMQRTAAQVVARARQLAGWFRGVVQGKDGTTTQDGPGANTPLGWAMNNLVHTIRLSTLPLKQGGRYGVDHRSGPGLIEYVADGMDLHRREFAATWGVKESEVLLVGILDPAQRFASPGDDSKAALDNLLGAAHSRICHDLDGCLVATSDTTKAAIADIDLETFLSADGKQIGAKVFAGSQLIPHIASALVAVCAEEGSDPLVATQWARVLQSRSGQSAEAHPFRWERHIGRFRWRPAQPLRARPSPMKGEIGDHGEGQRRPSGPRLPSKRPMAGPPERGSGRKDWD